MKKGVKRVILFLAFTVVGISGYLGYKALFNPKDQTQVMEKPGQYQQEAIKDFKKSPYLAKDLTAEDAENAILDWPDFSGYKNSPSKPFEILSAKYLSKNEMKKIDKNRIEEMVPDFKKAWFVQIKLPDGAYTGFFLVEHSDLGKICYRQLWGTDPMHRMIMENHQIYK